MRSGSFAVFPVSRSWTFGCPNLRADLEPLIYRELQQLIDSVTGQLNNFGIESRHRVAVILSNSSATAAAYLGVLNCCALVPLNPDYREREFEYFFSKAGIDALSCGSSADLHTLVNQIGEALGVSPGNPASYLAALEVVTATYPAAVSMGAGAEVTASPSRGSAAPVQAYKR